MPDPIPSNPTSPDRNHSARRFVDAVHRRLVLLRLLEHLGQGFLAASILASLLMGVAIWQSMPAAPILAGCGCLGAALGIGLSVARWPPRWTAAVEADRQLKLDDLLTTALSCTDPRDEFHAMVIATAGARCAMHAPSEVLLRRLGFRSWSEIGLAMGIAITMALIPLGPSKSQANDANSLVLSETSTAPPAATAVQQSRGPIGSTAQQIDESASNSSIPVDQTLTQQRMGGSISPSALTTANHPAAAGTSASTASKSSAKVEQPDSASRAQNPTAEPAGGGSVPSGGSGRGNADGISGRGGSSSESTPRWAGGYNADAPNSSALAADQIPPEDRDLVKRFFQKP